MASNRQIAEHLRARLRRTTASSPAPLCLEERETGLQHLVDFIATFVGHIERLHDVVNVTADATVATTVMKLEE